MVTIQASYLPDDLKAEYEQIVRGNTEVLR